MIEQQPQDDHADSRQKSTRRVRFKIRTFLLWGNSVLSSEPPWIIRFDHSYYNFKPSERETLCLKMGKKTLGLYVSAERHPLLKYCHPGFVYIVTDCLVFQSIVSSDNRNNRKVFWEWSTLILRLCNLYLCQVFSLWSETDVFWVLTHCNHVQWLCYIFQEHS